MAIAKSQWDAIIIGAGGSGLRAAYSLSESGFKTAVLSKVFPTRSHTVSAQGGITAAVPNSDENDDWRYHMYDTVKGADYIGDQDCIEYMCKTGPEVVYEMENMGMPFSRMDNGRIYQRPFGGQTKNYGQGQAARTCAAADRTGHALLHTLYQQNLKVKTTFFSEWYVLDFVKDNAGKVVGVTAICIESGEVVFFQSRVCILATGGAGRIYQSTTNALINTGDGFGMALRAGLPLQDMEMWQFHPTGIAGSGVLVSESCRGEGGFLVNKDGERFMERYAPHVKDLACRDVVARSIALEIKAGKGCDPSGVDHVKLKLDHLGADLIKSRLPGIRELSMTFAGVDPIVEPIPVVPTCHYVMGGIPTNRHSQVLTLNANGDETPVDGLYAVGECACVSVHGANRLGGNSLLDLLVFGRAAGLHIGELMQNGGLPSLGYVSNEEIDQSLSRYRRWETSGSSNNATDPNVIYSEMQKIMQNSFGVFRTGEIMADGLKQLNALREQLQYAALKDKSRVFNTARISALELDNLLATACATALSALTRTESRGAHTRDDFPERDDVNWIKHTLYFAGEDKHSDKMAFRPVNNKPLYVPAFEPIERIY